MTRTIEAEPEGSVSRVIRLNFLAPSIVESFLAGNQPAALDAKRLLALRDLALAWP